MVDVLEKEHLGGESLLSKVDIVNSREGGLVEAMVPIDLIDRSEVAVNEFHVRELAESMAKESGNGIINGQLTPVLLGEVPGKSQFSIIDGFHRDAALKRLDTGNVFATIRLNTTAEEVDDLRILTANSHSSVAFSRIVDWVGGAWERTSWAQTITAAQAFALANSKLMTGARIGLTEDAASAIREWALDKCSRWRIAPGTIYQSMATAQLADPDLVARARQRDSGHRLDELTPDHLKYIARAYPNKNREQNNVASIVTANNLTIQETKQVLDILGGVDHDDMVTDILELTDWKTLLDKDELVIRKRKKPVEEATRDEVVKRTEPRYRPKSRSKVVQSTSDPSDKEFARALEALTTSQIDLAKLSLKNLVLTGSYIPSRTNAPMSSPIKAAGVPSAIAESLIVDISKVPDTLQLLFDELRRPIIDATIITETLDVDTAEYVVQEAFHRISADAQRGPLRFAFPRKKENIVYMVNNGIKDELALMNATQPRTLTSNVENTVAFDDILALMPTLRPTGRIALAMFTIMDTPELAVQQVVRMNNQEVSELKDLLIAGLK